MRAGTVLLLLVFASCENVRTAPTSRPVASVTAREAAEFGATAPARGAVGNLDVLKVTRPVPTDPNLRFESVDVYVNTADPNGMRELASYLMRPDDWILVKMQLITPTKKHYRFQRVTSPKEMPDIDPLRPPAPSQP